MNEIIKTILERRSIRKFNDKHIKSDDLRLLAECALNAPSARGLQTWHFVVINKQELIDELIGIMKKELNDEKYDMYCPKALIIPANKKENNYAIEDNACALENIFIAAKSLNIGSVWINQLRHYNDSEELRKYFSKIGIDESMVVYGIAALGYYDVEPVDKIVKGNYTLFD